MLPSHGRSRWFKSSIAHIIAFIVKNKEPPKIRGPFIGKISENVPQLPHGISIIAQEKGQILVTPAGSRKDISHHRRMLIDKHILPDRVTDYVISVTKLTDLLDFRSRLLCKCSPSTVNSVMGVLKIVFMEGYFREELDRNPTEGIGAIKYTKQESGIFTLDELSQLFLEDSRPWADEIDYICFFLAASTGMRRGEILVLKWQNLDIETGVGE